jgi:hypothetical protein
MNLLFWLCIIEFVIILALSYYLFKFAKIILNVQTVLEDSLDLLDEKYKSISGILEKPVFFDSVEVRQVISDIYDCQNSIYNIANAMTNIDNLEKINEREEESQESK